MYQEEHKTELLRVANERTGGRGLAHQEIGAYTKVVSEYWGKLDEDAKADYQMKADAFNNDAKEVKAGSSA